MTARKKSGTLFACVAVGALFAIVGLAVVVGTSNSIAGKSQEADMAWEHVENEFERRVNLTTNLLGIVSASMALDKDSLAEMSRACASVREQGIDQGHAPAEAAVLAQFEKAQEQFAFELRRFLDEVKRSPALQANTKVGDLQGRLAKTTGQIQMEIVGYNEAVRRYNATITSFPGVLLARIKGYQAKPLLALSEHSNLQGGTNADVRAGATMPTQP